MTSLRRRLRRARAYPEAVRVGSWGIHSAPCGAEQGIRAVAMSQKGSARRRRLRPQIPSREAGEHLPGLSYDVRHYLAGGDDLGDEAGALAGRRQAVVHVAVPDPLHQVLAGDEELEGEGFDLAFAPLPLLGVLVADIAQ